MPNHRCVRSFPTRRSSDLDRAFQSWRNTTAKERAGLLRKWFDLMMANQEDLAVLMTREQGKPLTESRGEIAYGAAARDRKSTRLNSSHSQISYAVFCLKKK